MQCTQFSQWVVTQFSQFSLLHLPALYKQACQEINVAGCTALLRPGDFGEAASLAIWLYSTDIQAPEAEVAEASKPPEAGATVRVTA